jgi:hypothetical protein
MIRYYLECKLIFTMGKLETYDANVWQARVASDASHFNCRWFKLA